MKTPELDRRRGKRFATQELTSPAVPRRSLRFSDLCLVLFSALIFLAASAASAVELTALPAQGFGVSHLRTSNPSIFAGPVVNNLLGADRFYSNGITGQSTMVANVEAGHLWNGHETMTHVSNFAHHPDAFGATTNDLYDRHATWVAMMIGGRLGGGSPGQHQTGIAPDTDLRSGALASSWSGTAYALSFGFTANSFVQPYDTYFGTADVINSSWGFTDPDGTNGFSIAMDGYAIQNPRTTFVTSSGNNGPGTNTVGSPGAAYNAITVGAVGNANTYNTIAGFSSRAPQDWGYFDGTTPVVTVAGVRAAVDIVAPGTTLTSAYYGGQTGGNNGSLAGSPNGPAGGPTFYSSGLNGTSFASPIVAGGVALLDSASYNTPALASNGDSRDARVLKAVLLNSADKLPGWDNGQSAHGNGNGGVETTQSLDYAQGAGMMNLDTAYDQYLSGTTDVAGTGSGNLGFVEEIGWDYGLVSVGTPNDYFINTPLSGGSIFNVTLDWFRERGFDSGTLSVAEFGEANLDLTVFDATGGVFGDVISESNSLYNLVEHLSFSIPETGYYGIRVDFTGTSFDQVGITSANYGLAWSGIEGVLVLNPAVIPEPSTALLLLIGLCFLKRRRSTEFSLA